MDSLISLLTQIKISGFTVRVVLVILKLPISWRVWHLQTKTSITLSLKKQPTYIHIKLSSFTFLWISSGKLIIFFKILDYASFNLVLCTILSQYTKTSFGDSVVMAVTRSFIDRTWTVWEFTKHETNYSRPLPTHTSQWKVLTSSWKVVFWEVISFPFLARYLGELFLWYCLDNVWYRHLTLPFSYMFY